MEKNKIDLSLFWTNQMDFPKTEEYKKMLNEFSSTERLMPFLVTTGNGDMNGFITSEASNQIDFNFEDLEDKIENLVESGVIEEESVYLVSGLAVRIIKRK
jgi:hypothetical protein